MNYGEKKSIKHISTAYKNRLYAAFYCIQLIYLLALTLSCNMPISCMASPDPDGRVLLGLPYPTVIAAWAAASRAMGTRKGEQLTYCTPASWKKATEAGSPPCSPQTPSLMEGRTALPFSTAM